MRQRKSTRGLSVEQLRAEQVSKQYPLMLGQTLYDLAKDKSRTTGVPIAHVLKKALAEWVLEIR